MKLTEERLVKMILEELDAMGEAYRGSAGQPLSRDQRRTARMKRQTGPGTAEPRKKGTEEEEAKRALDFQVNPIVMLPKQGAIKGLLAVSQETYNAIQGREDLTKKQKALVVLKED